MYEAPPPHVERPLGLGIEAHREYALRRHDVVARRIVRLGILRAEDARRLSGGDAIEKSTIHAGIVWA